MKGVVDSDFESLTETSAEAGALFQLPLHEIENLFLHPQSLQLVAKRLGRTAFDAMREVRRAMDLRAGRWIYDHAAYFHNRVWKESISSERLRTMRKCVSSLNWQLLSQDAESEFKQIARSHERQIVEALLCSVACYRAARDEEDFWRHCFGKEVLKDISEALGLRSGEFLETAMISYWQENKFAGVAELIELRRFLACHAE